MLQRERCLQITLTLTFQQHVRFIVTFQLLMNPLIQLRMIHKNRLH